MSIRPAMINEIRRLRETGELILVDEMTVPFSQVRPIYMVPEVFARVFGPSAEETKRMGFLEADLRTFINGDKVTVAHGDEATCTLKPLADCDEVWTLRSRKPKPALRLFGRFAGKDVFIATNLEYRSPLGVFRSREWAVEIRRCVTTWTRLFPYLEPHTGNSTHDYLSNAVDLDHDIP